METRVKGMEDSVKMSMSFFEKSVAGLATRDTVGAVETTLKGDVVAMEKTLKAEVGEKTAALEKTLKGAVDAVEKTLKGEVGAVEKTLKGEVGEKIAALEKTLKAEMDATEKIVIGKLDTMNNVVWRFAGVLILTALLAPNIRDMWTAPKKPE